MCENFGIHGTLIFSQRKWYLIAPFQCFHGVQHRMISVVNIFVFLYPPQTVFVGGYTVFTLSDRTNDHPTERVSVTFCFLNNFKNH